MPRTATSRTNRDVLRGTKLEHNVFCRTSILITISACDLREQFLRSSSVSHQHAFPECDCGPKRRRIGGLRVLPWVLELGSWESLHGGFPCRPVSFIATPRPVPRLLTAVPGHAADCGLILRHVRANSWGSSVSARRRLVRAPRFSVGLQSLGRLGSLSARGPQCSVEGESLGPLGVGSEVSRSGASCVQSEVSPSGPWVFSRR